MSPDPTSRDATFGISQADSLYKGFPDFSHWEGLTPSDVDLWNRFAASLESRRESASPEALKSAVEVAMRAAALDTGALEGLYRTDRGFTMTVALQHFAWEHAIEERGAGVRELFEAQLQAYEMVLDAATRNQPISEAWIRALHEVIVAPETTYRVRTEVGWQEQELPKGQYKTHPNHVLLTDGTFHSYSPVDRVPEEMRRLVEQMRTPEFSAAYPILQASYCHYAFVVIHPFADGNGRVARALASTFFYRAQSIPLVIFANQRPAYLDALHAADLGNFRPVISFFRDRGIDTMQLVSESLLTSEMPRPEDLTPRVVNIAAKRASATQERFQIAHRLLAEVEEQIKNQVKDLNSEELRLYPSRSGGGRFALMGKSFSFGIESETYRSVLDVGAYVIGSEEEGNPPFPYRIAAKGSPDFLDIRFEDLSPELSASLKLRLAGWVRRRLTEALTDLEESLSPEDP